MEENRTKDIYWKTRMNKRKLALNILSRLWIVIAGAAAGVLLGVLAYEIWHAATDGERYKAYSEYYLDFAIDPTGEAYDYYNAYTWNDLMTTDPIAQKTLTFLTADGTFENMFGTPDVRYLEQVTTADVLSDIRVLSVTINENDETKCAMVQSATEKALETFGSEVKEFDKISVIKSVKPERIYADTRTLQAAELGAIIGALIAMAAVWFLIVLDDRIFFPVDLEAFHPAAVGVSFSGEASDMNERFELPASVGGVSPEEMLVTDAGAYADLKNASADPGKKTESDKAGKKILINVPYGKVRISLLNVLIDRITSEGGDVAAIRITDADPKAYRRMYFLS